MSTKFTGKIFPGIERNPDDSRSRPSGHRRRRIYWGLCFRPLVTHTNGVETVIDQFEPFGRVKVVRVYEIEETGFHPLLEVLILNY